MTKTNAECGAASAELGEAMMNDDKRFLRKLKRDVKQTGNRKRRRFLKDVHAEPDDFDFGRTRSDVMNEPRKKRPRSSEE